MKSTKDLRQKTTAGLKSMIMQFTVEELQLLISTCGTNMYQRYWNKNELRACVENMLCEQGPSKRDRVAQKMIELYNKRYVATYTNNLYSQLPRNPVSVPTSYTQNPSYIPFGSSQKGGGPSYINYNNFNNQMSVPGPGNLRPYVASSVQKPKGYVSSQVTAVLPVHPDVTFRPLPFFDVIDVLIKPTSLQPKTVAGTQGTSFVFHLSPYQTQLITNSRSFITTSVDYHIQVQMRFCLNETSCPQEDFYPPKCKITVNGKGIILPGQPPPTAKNQEPRKPHRAINITSLCLLSPMQSNQIQMYWTPSDHGQYFAATVQLVKCVQVETLIQKLKSQPICSSAQTVSFIKEKLCPDDDSEVAMTSLKVSLCCPIGMTRMTTPCRAMNCKHLQCFDGGTYIQMNEKKPSWLCPVCDQKAYYQDLFQDGLFTGIIAKATCDDIVFFADGSWQTLEDLQQGQTTRNLPDVADKSESPKCAVSEESPALDVSGANKDQECTSQGTSRAQDLSPSPQTEERSLPEIETSVQSKEIEHNVASEANISPEQLYSPSEPTQEENVEIITIDDSDDDDDSAAPETSVSLSCSATNERTDFGGNDLLRTEIPFLDSDTQARELSNFLANEDRTMSEMYQNQNTLMSQLSNVEANSQISSSVIEISD